MAVTAKFQADFSSFIAAIDKAEVALVDFGKGAGKVESQLNKMVDSFSGRKLIQEASLMTIAVEKAGGTAKLTARELEQVGAKANEAADKMRRLGYEVPAGLQKLADETKGATGNLQAMKSVATSLFGAFTITAAVGAIISFGKATLDAADELTKLHDKTGITVEGLQRFQAAGDDAGNTIDDITGAIVKMEDKLVSGDSSAAGALKKLGLSFADLKGLSPENQFIAISDAIRQVKDPAEQVNIAIDLFGKQGANVLPTLKRGFDDLRDSAVGMSADTVQALDDVGDALARMSRKGKADAAELFSFLFLGWGKADREAKRFKDQLDNLTSPNNLPAALPSLTLTHEQLQTINHDLDEQAREHKKAAEEAKRHAEQLQKAAERFRESVQALSFKKFIDDSIPMVGLIQDLSDRSGKFREGLDNLNASVNEFHDGITVAGDEITTVTIPMFSTLPNVVAKNTDAFKNAAKATFSWSDSLKGLVTGNFGASISAIGGQLKDMLNPSKILNTAIGGGLSGLISAGISGIGALFGKLFSNPEKEINPIREAFVQLNGGLAALNKHAHDAGVTLDALLNAKNPEQYKKAIDDLNAAFAAMQKKIDDANGELADFLQSAVQMGGVLPKSFDAAIAKLIEMGRITEANAELFKKLTGATSVDFHTMEDIAKKYGIALSDLGPAFQSAKLNDAAKAVINDFDTLARGGADVDKILAGMKKPINDIVNDSIKFGVAIPENMKPWIEQLLKTHQLIDENGDEITDLSKIKFADPIVTEFDKLIKKIQELIDKLTGPLTGAITGLPSVTVGVDVNDGVRPEPVSTGGLVTAHGVQHFARGGRVLPFLARGTDTVPAMLTPGEIVLNKAQQQRLASSDGGDLSGVRADLQAIRAALEQPGQDVQATIMMDGVQVGKVVFKNVRNNTGGIRSDALASLGSQVTTWSAA